MAKKPDPEAKSMKKSTAFELVVDEIGMEADIQQIVDLMKEKHNVEMGKNMASTYRSNLRKKRANAASAEAAEVAAPAKAPRGRPIQPAAAGNEEVVEFMTEVREWESKLGPDMIQKLVKVMYHV